MKAFYSTCVPPGKNDKQDCYLPYKYLPTGKANMIIVDIDMNVRLCRTIGRKNCAENITVYVRKGNDLTKNGIADFSNRASFEELQTVPPPPNSPGFNGIFRKTNARFKIHKASTFKGFQLALRTRYFCGTINDIKIHYNKCPGETNNLVGFAETAAPDEGSPDIQIDGFCADNAVKASPTLSMKCRPDGSAHVIGKCVCKAGFVRVGKRCKPSMSEFLSFYISYPFIF